MWGTYTRQTNEGYVVIRRQLSLSVSFLATRSCDHCVDTSQQTLNQSLQHPSSSPGTAYDRLQTLTTLTSPPSLYRRRRPTAERGLSLTSAALYTIHARHQRQRHCARIQSNQGHHPAIQTEPVAASLIPMDDSVSSQTLANYQFPTHPHHSSPRPLRARDQRRSRRRARHRRDTATYASPSSPARI